MRTLGIGMVGYGFIGKVHTLSYLNLPFYYSPVPAKLKMVGVCSSPIDDAYLGFLVVKPVFDSKNNPLLGRTLLAPYPHIDGDCRREHLRQNYKISLYGLPLNIESLPFQMQDQSVGACATTSCWVSLHALNNLFAFIY